MLLRIVAEAWEGGEIRGSGRGAVGRFTCAAPTKTAAMRGVVPKKDRRGAKVFSKRIREKNPAPVRARTVGVTRAAVVHPNFWKMKRPRIIITRVMVPVAVLKLPCGK